MKDSLSAEQVKEILDAFDEALQNGPWDESNFLKIIGNSLRNLREDLVQQSQDQDKVRRDARHEAHVANRIAQRSGQVELFVALYCSDGGNVAAWERLVNSLPRQIVSRPVYANEEDLKAMIRTKAQKNNEAYVSVYVNQQDILELSEDRIPHDRRGKALVSLKNTAIQLENISRFFHASGTYEVREGRLFKVSSSS